jgi:hypothetical protein
VAGSRSRMRDSVRPPSQSSSGRSWSKRRLSAEPCSSSTSAFRRPAAICETSSVPSVPDVVSTKQVREVEDRELRHREGHYGRDRLAHVHRACTHALDELLLVAERRVREHVDLDLAVGLLAHQIGEVLDDLPVGVVRHVVVPSLQGHRPPPCAPLKPPHPTPNATASPAPNARPPPRRNSRRVKPLLPITAPPFRGLPIAFLVPRLLDAAGPQCNRLRKRLQVGGTKSFTMTLSKGCPNRRMGIA